MELKRVPLLAFLIPALLVVPDGGGASDPPPQNLLGDPGEYSVPFREGESLRFEVNWKPLFLIPAFKAGEFALSIKGSYYNDHWSDESWDFVYRHCGQGNRETRKGHPEQE